MASPIEQIRQKARKDIHTALSRRANYYVAGNALPQIVTVRISNEFAQEGDLKGTTFNYAQRQSVNPVALFMLDECCPSSKNYLVVETGEAYFTGSVRPRHGQTVEVELAVMLPEMVAKLGLESPR